jgi:hydrogenase maturation protein HypF
LLPKRPRCAQALTDIAPGIAWLGVMLPYTPLHYLLFHEAAGRPQGTDWLAEAQPLMLVMTSANPRGEPLVADNAVALQRLHGIADAFLMHDRDIAVRCDDSVVRAQQHGFSMIRRARGYTPRAILLPRPGPPVLACGGWYKNTVCLTRNDQAFLSQHIGDLDHAATCEVLAQTVRHLAEVLEIKPQRVAHDLHPDFFSTQFAQGYAAAHGIAAIPVQHHHAHIAGVIAEHRLQGPVLGLALDGIGLGTDNGLWGGELLRVEDHRFTRLGHLAALPLPGAERAAREPWRCAAGALHALGRQEEITRRFPSAAAAAVAEMLAKGIHTPGTSSAGRLFDAAAGLLGVQPRMSFEGQAAMRLEGLAAAYGPVPPDVGGYRLEDEGILNMLPLLGRLCEDIPADYGAALFHATLIAALAAWLQRAAAGHGLRRIVLSGGCFQNHLLSTGLRTRLAHMQSGAGLGRNDRART